MGISFLLLILWAAFVFAKLEIEIEGKHGWAEKLPTWRVERHVLLDMFFGGRPLTGYHVWAFLFVFTMFHLPFAWNGSWSLTGELRVLGGYTLFWIVEDLPLVSLQPALRLEAVHARQRLVAQTLGARPSRRLLGAR